MAGQWGDQNADQEVLIGTVVENKGGRLDWRQIKESVQFFGRQQSMIKGFDMT